MKRQVRKSVFETNSSSSHSIVVTKNDVHVKPDDFKSGPEHIYIRSDGVWDIAWEGSDLSFDRYPMNLLVTVEEKARYVFAEYCGFGSKEKVEEITAVLKKIIPGLKEIRFPVLSAPVYEHLDGTLVDPNIPVHAEWGADPNHYYIKDGEKVPVKESDRVYMEEPNYGYVDHQSQGIVDNFIRQENISLEEFLSNRRYVICIDGDEYDFWGKFQYSGLIDMDNIVGEYSGSDEDLRYSVVEDGDSE